ncbi:MAG: hypothetical protein IT372_19800 [Polyangiaceae bacterium]|nr:hypothetical protein [Polyangiaceae bacterium]
MKRAVQTTFFVLCVLFSVAAVYNVFADNAEVEQQARAVACGDQGASCSPQMTRMERTPFGQTFEFATAKRTVGVRCTRAFVLAGEYSCALR